MSMNLIVIISVLFGMFIMYVFMSLRNTIDGSLRIDTSDPEDNPYLFLEVSTSIPEIYKKKYVRFEVNTENYISQK